MDHHADAGYFVKLERAIGRHAVGKSGFRSDKQFWQIQTVAYFVVILGGMDRGSCLQAGPDRFVGALNFECTGNDAAKGTKLGPFPG